MLGKVTGAFGQELDAQKAQKLQKSKNGTNWPTDQQRTNMAGSITAKHATEKVYVKELHTQIAFGGNDEIIVNVKMQMQIHPLPLCT